MRSQLHGGGQIVIDTDLPIIIQEVIDYHIFDRPSFKFNGKMVECADLALLEESDLAQNSVAFLNSVYTRLGQKLLKALDSHCAEKVSSLDCHNDSELLF
jgi:hypothetical protein